MAVTITRSTWIDDDGTGTTGTVINQALHTTLYNEIDTALAKVAQLAGGNTLTGTQQTILGVLAVGTATAGIGQVSILTDPNHVGVLVTNGTATPTQTFLGCYNNTPALIGYVGQATATTVVFSTTSDARLKDDAGAAHDLTALRGLVVHDFTWKADGVRDRGIFAQEAHDRYPRAVTVGTDETTADGSLARPWMTDYSKFVPDLIVGWQQHDVALAEIRATLRDRGLNTLSDGSR